jgi:hypothetical protein
MVAASGRTVVLGVDSVELLLAVSLAAEIHTKHDLGGVRAYFDHRLPQAAGDTLKLFRL